jgi:hypothetical protein
VELFDPLLCQPEAYIRVGHRIACDQLRDVPPLGAFCLQKFEPGGRIKEQVFNRRDCSNRRACRTVVTQFASFNLDFHAGILAVIARDQCDATNRRDARQRLPAKPQRANMVQV